MSVSADSGISLDELRLAARNHAMPLEALRWAITPVGLHYLLIHYDVPLVDPAAFRLEVGGAVQNPLALHARRPQVASCGRARGDDGVRRQRPCAPRAPARQPALAHRGRRDRTLAGRRARGVARGGGARPVRGGRRVRRPRSWSRGRRRAALRAEPGPRGGAGGGRGARLRDERRPDPAAARLPAPSRRARVVRDDERQVAHRDLRSSRSRTRGTRSRAPTGSDRPRTRRGGR